LYSADQVRERERRAFAGGVDPDALMEQAGAACWAEIAERWPEPHPLDVLCGPGNNGGDGYVIARLAALAGRAVRVWSVGAPRAGSSAERARARWTGAVHDWTSVALNGAVLVVDALLGIGCDRPLDGVMREAVLAMRACRDRGARVFSVDVPSGLDADTGAVQGVAVQADVTMILVGRKFGLYTGDAVDHVGERLFAPLLGSSDALDAALPPLARLLTQSRLSTALPLRARSAHKGRHGHVLLIGGDRGMAGAILLAARAAMRSGAGLVSVATRAEHAVALTAAQPEIMVQGVAGGADLLPMIARASVLAIGPGLGQGDWSRSLWKAALDSGLPLVVDADALNLLAQHPQRREDWILTPHPGEAGRLLARSTAEIQADRRMAAQELHRRYGGVVVLKGAGSLVQGGTLAVCPYGNPGMAVGGMGDVLTGVVAALRAQGLDPHSAASQGVLAHALAGDRAAAEGERGLSAGDVVRALRAVVNP